MEGGLPTCLQAPISVVPDGIAPPHAHASTTGTLSHTPPTPTSPFVLGLCSRFGTATIRYDRVSWSHSMVFCPTIFRSRTRCALPDCREIVTCVLRWRVLLLPPSLFALCTDCCVRLLVSETSNSVKSDAMGRDWAGERSLS